MTDREALLAAALDNPTDDTARLVLADFLQEHGEPELGRFLWAGVIAARFRFRGPEPDERADQAAALAEIVAQVRDRNPVGWVAALGLGPQPPTPTDGAAEHITDDRVSVRIGATSAEFERDMLIALSLTLGEWSDIAGRLLVAWPVERVTVRDVPGMAFWVEPPADDRPGWELSASLTVQPRRPVEHGFWR
ncbi:MAG TPA: TIGR02996 domain-containing protein, partial [Gemmataceae bacterium]|nr:TIGR02996 domain-containing protein [Gemmataceae bacterium]